MIEEQALRLRNLEEQLHRCLWQTPAAREEAAKAGNEEGPAAAEPSGESPGR